MKHLLLLVLLLCISFSAFALQFAKWHTSMGDFTCKLYTELAPITTNNFITLTNSGFYNNLIFHRVVANFVIQDGDPLGTGYGGPGYTIPDEVSPYLHHDQAGILAMAKTSQPNSAGSQYYITLAPAPHLDGTYAIFGKVIEGLDTVLSIGTVATNANGLPLTPVNIHTLSMIDLSIGVLTPPNDAPIQVTQGESLMFVVESSSNNGQHSYKWFIGEEEQIGQTDFIFETSIDDQFESPVRCRISQGDFSYDIEWEFIIPADTEDDIIPVADTMLKAYPNPFGTSTTISYRLKEELDPQISIFNLRGQLLKSYAPGLQSKGENSWVWDGKDTNGNRCAPGVYLIKLKAGEDLSYGKLIIQN